MKSYTATKLGLFSRIEELCYLYRQHSYNPRERIRIQINRMKNIEHEICEHFDASFALENLRVLEIGPGQNLAQLSWLAVNNNKASGIDLDVIPQRFQLSVYLRMWRKNGLIRVVKTLGKKITGLERKYRYAIKQELGLSKLPYLDLNQMNASNMIFPDLSFDLVYSFSVFEHIEDPESALKEIVRVLRPGGYVYISLLLYTCDSGCHDPKIFSGKHEHIPMWSHLRPQYQAKINENTYLNKYRIAQWHNIIYRQMPGAKVTRVETQEHRTKLKELREKDELEDYSDEELLTNTLKLIWTKAK